VRLSNTKPPSSHSGERPWICNESLYCIYESWQLSLYSGWVSGNGALFCPLFFCTPSLMLQLWEVPARALERTLKFKRLVKLTCQSTKGEPMKTPDSGPMFDHTYTGHGKWNPSLLIGRCRGGAWVSHSGSFPSLTVVRVFITHSYPAMPQIDKNKPAPQQTHPIALTSI